MTDREPPFAIVEGDAADLDGYIELLEEASRWLWEKGVRQWPPGSNRALAPLLREQVASGTLVLARVATRLAGGCILSAEPSPEWGHRPGSACYLHKLVVARFAAGRSLGSVLLGWAEAWTSRRRQLALRLDCWDANAALRRYYRDRGYAELEAVPSFGTQVRLFEKRVAGGPAHRGDWAPLDSLGPSDGSR